MRARLTRAAMAAGVIGGLIGAAVVANPMAASAATQYVCDLTGTTTSLTPPIPAPPKTGGSGSFAFSGTATCVNGAKVQNVGISSSGTYKSTVCGTGSASGTASFTGGPSPINYTITFVAGQGSLKVTSGGKGNGAVSITPSNTGGCVTAPVTGFTVRGVATIKQ